MGGEETDTRDFLFSEIAAVRILQALDGKHDGLLNIASGKERRIFDVANVICKYLGVKGINKLEGGINAIPNRTLDIGLLESKFGTLEDEFEINLVKTIDWFDKNRDTARR